MLTVGTRLFLPRTATHCQSACWATPLIQNSPLRAGRRAVFLLAGRCGVFSWGMDVVLLMPYVLSVTTIPESVMNEIDAAYNLVHDYPGGADSLGPRVAKNPITLCHEVAEVGTAKFGLKTAVKVSVASGDKRILEAFAAKMGCWVLPLPLALQLDDDGCMVRLSDILRDSSDLVRESVADLADRKINDNERARLERMCAQMISSVSAFMAAVNIHHQAGKQATGFAA